jgi:hypothetical protein
MLRVQVQMSDDDFYEATPWMIGSCYQVSGDPKFDVIEELYKVVEEVTGKPVLRPRNKIGFY